MGCSITAYLFLKVPDSDLTVFIPNAFSPNEDGINDGFTVYAGIDVAEISRLSIFNRWGSKIWENQQFKPNQHQLGWDGTFNGQKVQSGIYVFTAEVQIKNGVSKTFSGGILVVE